MSATQRSVTTATYIFIARVIGLIANTIVVILVTRYLGREAFGQYTFAMGYYYLVASTLATGGAFSILIRETAKDHARAGENLGFALQIQTAFTLLLVALAFVALPFFTREPIVVKAVYINLVTCVIQVIGNLYTCLFTAFEDTRYTTISTFIERGVYLIGIVLVIWLRWGFLTIFWMQLVSFTIRFLFCAWIVRVKFARIVWRYDRSRLAYFLRESWPLVFSTGFRALNAQLDTLLLQLLQTAAELGLYGAPYRIISRLDIVPDSVMAGLLPALSKLAQNARDKSFYLYGKVFKYFLIVSLPIAVITSLLSRPLMILVFGPDYADGAPALSIMAWMVVFMFLNFLFKYVLTALGRQQYETISLAVSLVVHGGLGVWLIPRWGATGAALAMLVGQAVAFVLGFIYVTHEVGIYRPWGVLAKLLIGAFPAWAIIYVWRQGSVLILFLLAGVLYLTTLIVLRVFERNEIEQLVQAFRPRWAPASTPAGSLPSDRSEVE